MSCIREKANHFFPQSFKDAPIWWALLSMTRKLSWVLLHAGTSLGEYFALFLFLHYSYWYPFGTAPKTAHCKSDNLYSIISNNIQLDFSLYKSIFVYLLANNEYHMVNTEQNHSLNRLKIVLVEQGKSGRWLAERLNKSEHTISRWCQNKTQPSVPQLNEIASILNVDIKSLLNHSRQPNEQE